ncbi:MAG: GNAT family N-acetyltransferase, partial [Acidobacteriota bacterium]|nr:GNAT family N-acetyltransferase [Acidobacteriota bacterium]
MQHRRATPADVPTLLAMQERFFADAGDALDLDASRAAMLDLIAHDSLGRFFVFEEANAIAGYMVIGFGFTLEFGGRDAFIDELYVAPHARGRGIGSAALQIAEEECRTADIRALHLEVAHENHRAR